MNLLPFFTWCDGTWLGQAIRGVTWAFPLIETIHIPYQFSYYLKQN